jgi:hypothetical protein
MWLNVGNEGFTCVIQLGLVYILTCVILTWSRVLSYLCILTRSSIGWNSFSPGVAVGLPNGI